MSYYYYLTSDCKEFYPDQKLYPQERRSLYSAEKLRYLSDDSASNNPEMSIDINGEIKMSNCDMDMEEDFDMRSLSSMRMKKLINSLEYLTVSDNKENQVSGKKPEMFSTLPLRKHSSMTTNIATNPAANSPLRPNKRVHSVEIPVSALPADQTVFQTDLNQGVAKLRVTPDEAREIMKFINEKIASRTSMQTAGTDPGVTRPPQECLPEETPEDTLSNKLPVEDHYTKIPETIDPTYSVPVNKTSGLIPVHSGVEQDQQEKGSSKGSSQREGSEGEVGQDKGFNSMPLMYRSGDKISLKEVEHQPGKVNDLNERKPDAKQPKLSFLNKLKNPFKSCSDKPKSPSIPQLSRPPSSYIGSQMSLNGSVPSLSQNTDPKPHTPVMELLSKNPEMCSQNSLNQLPKEVRAEEAPVVKAEPSEPSSRRSRSSRRDEKPKRRSRSKSLSKLLSDVARKAKSLTEVSPIPNRGEDPEYANQISTEAPAVPPTPLSPPPPVPPPVALEEEDRPEKKKLSLVSRLKRRLSIGKGDKPSKAEKAKELSKSTPVLNQNPPPAAALPRPVKRARSSEDVSTTSSVTAITDVRTQIVLRQAKLNKGCRCQVCSLVRKNIRSHCSSQDPNRHHKYEVVLKMNLLGGDFMNSECGSVASYQGHDTPDEIRPDLTADLCPGILEEEDFEHEGCIAADMQAEIASLHSADNQLRTKTQSEIQDIVECFQQETRSASSHHTPRSASPDNQDNTDCDLSDIRNAVSSPLMRGTRRQEPDGDVSEKISAISTPISAISRQSAV